MIIKVDIFIYIILKIPELRSRERYTKFRCSNRTAPWGTDHNGRGGLNCPKNCPHGLWMPSIVDRKVYMLFEKTLETPKLTKYS